MSTRPTIKSLTADNARLREQLATTEHLLSVANATIAGLTTPKPTRPAAPVRYWDEFAERREALDWARENRAVLRQRPREAA
jgi:hypothetical protein